ncbi:class I SAM-dependent methyltransferase [Jannaschia marina]|uniref:class I SAM-dependent methyltransferase n=1 Tax=Jannaschia marina TaxID=2741674 RepID=UPI0015CA81ED|nr:class I SAM-dependent methyltransferase [Jannaschia marina]
MASSTSVPFTPTRYDAVAENYTKGRVVYAPYVIRRAARIAGLGPDSTALDLGCGPGMIAKELSKYSGDVLGVDPSKEMIRIARRDAPSNVRFLVGSSNDLSFVDRPLALVTFGRSFHWMDRDQTLADLDGLVAPGGCLALFGESPVGGGRGSAHAWWREVKAYLQRQPELTEGESALFGPEWERNEFPLYRSAFSEVTYHGTLRQHRWTYKRVRAYALSRSVSSAERLGDRLPEFENGLREILKKHGPGPWTTLNQHRLTIARRPE